MKYQNWTSSSSGDPKSFNLFDMVCSLLGLTGFFTAVVILPLLLVYTEDIKMRCNTSSYDQGVNFVCSYVSYDQGVNFGCSYVLCSCMPGSSYVPCETPNVYIFSVAGERESRCPKQLSCIGFTIIVYRFLVSG